MVSNSGGPPVIDFPGVTTKKGTSKVSVQAPKQNHKFSDETKRAFKKMLLIQGASVFLIAGSVGLFTLDSYLSADNNEAAVKLVSSTANLEKQVSINESMLESMPAKDDVARWSLSATEMSQMVADKQNGLLAAAGPIDLSAVPTHEMKVSGVLGREYSEEERISMATTAQSEARSNLMRELLPLFDSKSAFNPAVAWHEYSEVPYDANLLWVSESSGVIADPTKGSIVVPVSWTLVNTESSKNNLVVKGSWVPNTKSFVDVSIYHVGGAA